MHWLQDIKGSMARINDRRRSPRVERPAILAFYCAGAEAVPHGIRDISHTGAYMYTEDRWYPGTLLQVTLDMDTDSEAKNGDAAVPSVTVWSKVVRHDEDGVGLEFVLVNRKRRESVYHFLAAVKSRNV